MMRYTKFFGIILLLGILMSACVDEFDRGDKEGDGKSIRLTLSVPDNIIINPMTKSPQALSQKVDNITVLVYDRNYLPLKSQYYPIGADDALNKGGAFVTEAISVGEDASGFVFVVANAGDLGGISYEELKKKNFGLNGTNPQPIMCASGDTYPSDPKTGEPTYSFTGISFDTKSNANITAELVRIYARVTVAVEFKDLQAGLTITPQTVKLYNIPQYGTLAGPNLINSSEESKREGEVLNSTKHESKAGNWDYTGTNGATTDVLYLYENMQPKGYCGTKNNGPDQTSKTPKSFGEATTNTTQLMTDAKSSFIEVTATYKKPTDNNNIDGKITYRFFLGKDAFTDFSVQRNVNYKITLSLTNKGGIDEATWRVETEKIPGKINVSDVYISYLGGSSAEMVVTGNVAGIIGEPTLGTVVDPGNTGGRFEMQQTGKTDTEMRLKFTATTTNVHDYSEKTMPVTFDMGGGKKYVVNVHQVPRLVDPIAIYKKATNEKATKIEVKAFNATVSKPGRYEILQSKGKWTAEIAGGDWYAIGLEDNKYGKNKIESEGPVVFWYKPDGPNPNQVDKGDGEVVDGARYGKIIVKYHGASCVHEIYLRQGYQPMILGDTEYAWSAFNCLGKEEDRDAAIGKTTDYPTQTGWLFNGGTDIAMHPFIPGYQVGKGGPISTMIKYSNHTTQAYGSGSPYYQRWQSEWLMSTGRPESKQGPCPQNYKVADAHSYSEMAKQTHLYTGYVHDDDEVRGWKYSKLSEGSDINPDQDVDDNNHCNPAKGSLYVGGDGVKNLFFNYGKGVLTNIRGRNGDPYLLDEIGVGRRFTYDESGKFGSLVYSSSAGEKQAYGALYWDASPYANNRIGKVDFMYNIFTPNPTVIDVPGVGGSEGIEITHNALFVRCVREAAERINLQILASIRIDDKLGFGTSVMKIQLRPKGSSKGWWDYSNTVSNIPDVNNYELVVVMKDSDLPIGDSVTCSKSDLQTSGKTITLIANKSPN